MCGNSEIREAIFSVWLAHCVLMGACERMPKYWANRISLRFASKSNWIGNIVRFFVSARRPTYFHAMHANAHWALQQECTLANRKIFEK